MYDTFARSQHKIVRRSFTGSRTAFLKLFFALDDCFAARLAKFPGLFSKSKNDTRRRLLGFFNMAKSIDTYNCCLFLKLSCLNQTLQAFCLFVSCLLQFGLLNQKPASLPINDSCTLHATRFLSQVCRLTTIVCFMQLVFVPCQSSLSLYQHPLKIRRARSGRWLVHPRCATLSSVQTRSRLVRARGSLGMEEAAWSALDPWMYEGSVVSTRSVDVRRQRGQHSIRGCTKAAWSALDPKQFMHPLPSERGSAPESLKNRIKSSAQLEASESDAAADDL